MSQDHNLRFTIPDSLLQNLPDAAGARRFFAQLAEKYPAEATKILRSGNQGLLSDVLAVAAWSPFLAITMLQHKDYLAWLGRKRAESQVRSTEDLLESLARFSLTNSQLDAHVLLSRFRRRELLRIYLRDIRRLATIAEITAELSNLADAILEFALKIALNELENRWGAPLEMDERGRAGAAQFCIVALGKLGSKELNYASDIDLLFIYSNDGATSGMGMRDTAKVITNKEFFIKLGELVSKIVGQAAGEGAAYRVDLRLRPHGRVGALAISVKEAVNYYQATARDWERQVLLRARAAAGDAKVFKSFYAPIEKNIYQSEISVADALESVRLSKHKINQEHDSEIGFNVKLGRGGIREIEFIAQALQLAYGGRDEWLRASHTLIVLSRLADRAHLQESELTRLSDAYAFLRCLEHRLQMEQGLQTHAVPEDAEKRLLVAKRMNFAELGDFNAALQFHTTSVKTIFERVFGAATKEIKAQVRDIKTIKTIGDAHEPNLTFKSSPNLGVAASKNVEQILSSLEKSSNTADLSREKLAAVNRFCEVSPHFKGILAANPKLIAAVPCENDQIKTQSYSEILQTAVRNAADLHEELAVLRTLWTKFYLEIAAFDAFEKIEMRESNRMQTALAEASLQAALLIVTKELTRKYGELQIPNEQLTLAVLGLGRLAGRGMDYGSDLDLVLIYDGAQKSPVFDLTNAEFYSRAVEILVTALSSLTREGYLYRVDLRLRPDGKNGATSGSKTAFLDYLETRSAIWEWLAYLKLRAVGLDDFAVDAETTARKIVHQKARQIEVEQLKFETKRIRDLLEQQKAKGLRRGEIDIKHGAGGLLDVYFAVRFLQLRDRVFDAEENRTTSFTLQKLSAANSIDQENFEILSAGYEFLRKLDHALRLVSGRSTRLPNAGNPLLAQIANRLKYDSATELFAELALQTANIRSAYEKLLS
ncbi:MAG: hypothetical protein ABI954_06055 [Pyrinomonadaceae bacterium]